MTATAHIFSAPTLSSLLTGHTCSLPLAPHFNTFAEILRKQSKRRGMEKKKRQSDLWRNHTVGDRKPRMQATTWIMLKASSVHQFVSVFKWRSRLKSLDWCVHTLISDRPESRLNFAGQRRNFCVTAISLYRGDFSKKLVSSRLKQWVPSKNETFEHFQKNYVKVLEHQLKTGTRQMPQTQDKKKQK